LELAMTADTGKSSVVLKAQDWENERAYSLHSLVSVLSYVRQGLLEAPGSKSLEQAERSVCEEIERLLEQRNPLTWEGA
jgi:hypothetical protein